eukprot:Ihof_evm1s541 gene=Ihof_evmTU1s541
MSLSVHAVKILYEDVMQDVIKSMKAEFENEGVDDQVLGELEALWRGKLDESGVLSDNITGELGYYEQNYSITYPHNQPAVQYGSYNAVPQQQAAPTTTYVQPNVAVDYSHLQQYGTQNMLFVPQTQTQTQVASQPQTQPTHTVPPATTMASGQAQPLQYNTYNTGPTQQYYTAPAATTNQPPQTTNLNTQAQAQHYYNAANMYAAYTKQQNQLPQTDGTSDQAIGQKSLTERELADRALARMCMERDSESTNKKHGPKTCDADDIPQLDGINTTGRQYQDLDAEELGSDLDEPDQDDGDEDPETDHLVLCQFDK